MPRLLLRFLHRAPALALSCILPPCAAEQLPFDTFNQSPLVQIYGLPGLGSARVLPTGATRVGLVYEAANHVVNAINGAERLELDGETHRTTLRIFRGVGRSAEIGIDLPHVSHSGGFLDAFIEDWHDAFGLPQNGRDVMAHNQLAFRYTRDGTDRVRITRATAGLGDARIGAALQLARAADGDNDLAVRMSLKLATGDSASLHGSGAADLAVWLSTACGQCDGRFSWYGGGGLLWLGSGDVLPEQQRRGAAFGSAGLHWRALTALTLTAQLDAHSRFYDDSGLRPLNAVSAQLVLGGTWSIARRLDLEIAVAEDAVVDTAPDVVLRIGLRSSF